MAGLASAPSLLAMRLLAVFSITPLLGCDRSVSTVEPAVAPLASSLSSAAAAPPFKVTASIQELMEAIVDPAADGVWEAVGTTITRKGIVNHQPRTDEEWRQVRLHAIALTEATNLLMMGGRRLVPSGGKIADDGSDGVLTTAAAEQLLITERETFVQFAGALNSVALQMLKAVDARQPQGMLEAGEAMDEVCESCHMKFWYPNQAVWQLTQVNISKTSE
jgi:hypothetical protein